MKKYKNSIIYLELAYQQVNSSSISGRASKLTDDNFENIASVIAIFRAAIIIQTENSLKKASLTLENALAKISDNNITAISLLKNILTKIYKNSIKDESILNNSDSDILNEEFVLPSKIDSSTINFIKDCINSKDLDNILYISCFAAHISENTPLVHLSELESMKSKISSFDYIESTYPESNQNYNQFHKNFAKPRNDYLKLLLSNYDRKFMINQNLKNQGPILAKAKCKDKRYRSEPRNSNFLPIVHSPSINHQKNKYKERDTIYNTVENEIYQRIPQRSDH